MSRIKPELADDPGCSTFRSADLRREGDVKANPKVGYLQQLVLATEPDLLEKGRSSAAQQVKDNTAALEAKKKKVRTKKEVEAIITAENEKRKILTAEKEVIFAKMKEICIKGRNNYLRQAIKQDFVIGIKELDQETAAEEDEANFNPDVDQRDYNTVAASPPVFCVGSRAFQRLNGRLQKGNFNAGSFQSVDDTEIPSLQVHAKKLTEGGRAAIFRQFLNNLMQLLNSMSIWTLNDGTSSKLSDFEKAREETRLRKRLNLAKQACHHEAICRRDEICSGFFGLKDFQEELFDAVFKNLAGGDLGMLGQQIEVQSAHLRDVRNAVLAHAQEQQREMVPAYEGCVNERGTGSFLRIRNLMAAHVIHRRGVMFCHATNGVQ
ncbi:hypothetical protein N0V88_005102 [Collariella sp. IMI 366227]|nr:hypothetical protein N0V88_005102 [Collariella sp. IMI 366227]